MNWIRGGHKPLMVTIGTRTMADTGSTDCDIKITVTQTYQALSDSKLCAQDWPSPGALGPGGLGQLAVQSEGQGSQTSVRILLVQPRVIFC